MGYEKIFEKPYPSGWKDLPNRTTPVIAEIMDDYDEAIEHIEDYLVENPIDTGTAADTSYDNTQSGLESDNVQGAIDELAAGAGGSTATTTTYDNTESGLQAENVQDAIDEIVANGGTTAETTSYDNTESGLEATNCQDAIDELALKSGLISGLVKLWENPDSPAGITTGTMELSDDYTNYDFLIFSSARSNGSLQGNGIISIEDLDISKTLTAKMITVPGAVGSYGAFTVTDSTHFAITSVSTDYGFRAIYGYKGGGGSRTETELISAPIDLTTIGMTIALSDSIKNYDELILKCSPSNATAYNLETRFALSDFVYGSTSNIYLTNEYHYNNGTGWFGFHPDITGDNLIVDTANYCILQNVIGVKY